MKILQTSIALGAFRLMQGRLNRFRGTKLFADATKLVSGTATAQAIGLLASPLLTRLFTPADFGVFAVMVALLNIVGVGSTLRLDMMIPPAHPKAAFAFLRLMALVTLAFAAAAQVIALAFTAPLGALMDLPEGTERILLVLPLLLIAHGAFLAFRSLAVRQGRFGPIGRSAVLRGLGTTVFWLGLGVLLSPELRYMVMPVGLAFGLLAAAIYLAIGIEPRARPLLFRLRLPVIVRSVRAQGGMIAAVTVGQTFSVLGQRLPILVIAAVYGPVPAGYYALAERIVLAPSVLVATAMADIYRQRASALFRKGQSFAPLLRRMALLTFSLSAVGFGLLAAVLLPTLGLVFGAEWEAARFTIGILILSAAAGFATSPFDCTPVIVGAKRYVVVWQVARAVLVGLCCAAAAAGYLTFPQFLIVFVSTRVSTYAADFIAAQFFAAKAAA